jgi:hypothetical protein
VKPEALQAPGRSAPIRPPDPLELKLKTRRLGY